MVALNLVCYVGYLEFRYLMKTVAIKQNKHISMFLLLAVVALIWLSSASKAAEVAPSQPNEPSPINQKFDPLDPNNQLVQKGINNKANGKAPQKKGWLDWLTDISRKPANFHYIDFIELFH